MFKNQYILALFSIVIFTCLTVKETSFIFADDGDLIELEEFETDIEELEEGRNDYFDRTGFLLFDYYFYITEKAYFEFSVLNSVKTQELIGYYFIINKNRCALYLMYCTLKIPSSLF